MAVRLGIIYNFVRLDFTGGWQVGQWKNDDVILISAHSIVLIASFEFLYWFDWHEIDQIALEVELQVKAQAKVQIKVQDEYR